MKVARALEASDNEIWLSPITLWETLTLAAKNRIALGPDAGTWMEQRLAARSYRQAAVTNEVALAVRTIDLSHRDPADRFLAATAVVYALTLVTGDERLCRSKQFAVLRNV